MLFIELPLIVDDTPLRCPTLVWAIKSSFELFSLNSLPSTHHKLLWPSDYGIGKYLYCWAYFLRLPKIWPLGLQTDVFPRSTPICGCHMGKIIRLTKTFRCMSKHTGNENSIWRPIGLRERTTPDICCENRRLENSVWFFQHHPSLNWCLGCPMRLEPQRYLLRPIKRLQTYPGMRLLGFSIGIVSDTMRPFVRRYCILRRRDRLSLFPVIIF